MRGSEMRLDGGQSVRVEVVHESERSRVVRLFMAGSAVVRKEPLGPDAQQRLRHEIAMLEVLHGIQGTAQLLDEPRFPGSIVLEDAGDTPLAGMAKPLVIEDLIGLGLELARAVAGMHSRGVMHRDITPANIVISRDGALCLVDFGLATSFGEIRPEFTHPTQILGTLAYLAPEQTGRTGRSVDQRADLYALGATLYELATGEPPFGTGDPLQLTHDHLARTPAPPVQLNPAVPQPLSDIIMHLLEKEPDNRYQTAQGVVYDLERVGDAPTQGVLRVGEHDVPLRLVPPSRLVGRDDEVAALHAALRAALAGRRRGVLVGGAPGVGKTALVDALRPVVTSRDGWFVAGKFDQYRRDLEFDAVNQAFRALGRLLLAEPDDELAELRGRILDAVGPNAGLLAAMVPEFAALSGVPRDAGDPLTAQVRAQRVAVTVLREVASPKRPVVVFVDDLQWAGRTPLGVVDLVLSDEPIKGLLLVAAYRDTELDAAHPLTAPLSRWRDQVDVQHLRLDNLAVSSLVTMVAEMLHVEPATAVDLVEIIYPHVSGNPYETVGLLNALRGEGVLTATAAGWRWDEPAVRAHLGQSHIDAMVAARVEAMPATTRELVEAMACLGGRAELSLLAIANDAPAGLEHSLAPAFDEGLMVTEPGAREAVRFRHDRIREAVLAAVDPQRRRGLQLAMARRLAVVPELFAVAAEQYLPVLDAIDDAAERQVVVGLLRRSAEQAALTGDHALVEALLAAAVRLIAPGETATLIEVHTGRHAALFSIGRLEEADEEYRTIERLATTALERADATSVQVRSLTHRNRFAEAIGLGMESLRELGIAVPTADRLAAELDHQFDHLYRWLDDTDAADDLTRPEITDPTLLAVTRLIYPIGTAAYFVADLTTMAWLEFEALRIWREHGPGRTLLGPASYAAYVAVALRDDYAASYQVLRRIVALGEARGYEPETSQARWVFADLACWFEPLENIIHAGRRAREGLIAGGDLASAGYVYFETAYYPLDAAPSLDTFVAEMEAGLAFARRTGNEQTGQVLESNRWLTEVLRGEASTATGEAVPVDRYADNPVALLYAHLSRAIAAVILGDPVGLERHSAAAMPLLAAVPGLYPIAVARLLRGLALAGQARTSDGDQHSALLFELDEVTRWLAARAADAPDNFRHLVRLLEAERAWAVGEFRAAVLAFDAARREAPERRRPWHQALITERAARFYLAHGVEAVGHGLLAQARQDYLAWGATAKVAQLDWAYPTLHPRPDQTDSVPRGSAVTTGTIDLLGILSASQVLSSQTSIEALHARVVEVLRAMTGATGVQLLMWNEVQQHWSLPAPGGGAAPLTADRERAVPMSVLRYAQRIGEPLVVADATVDDRFARDPYFTDVDCCSLLALPIRGRGSLQAVLLLENRLIRDAFTAERLDAVKLIAGQLTVSLDNAQLYAQYRRIADEQAALRRVATLVAEGSSPTTVFEAVAAEMERLLDADRVTLGRYEPGDEVALVAHRRGPEAHSMPPGTRISHEGENVTTVVRRTERPARIDHSLAVRGVIADITRGRGVRADIGAPIVVEGRLWGVISAAWTGEELPPAGIEDRMAQFAQLLGTAIANADSRTQLTASRARLLEAGDEARRRVARDVHDGAQQRLVQITLMLKAARQALAANDGTAETLIGDAFEQVEQANVEVRELAHGILPGVLTSGGLKAGLKALARRLDLPVQVDIPAERFAPGIEANAYFIVAEALTNVVKHAQATRAEVTASVADGTLRVEVRDDGVGGADPGGHGLVGIADRATALGGRLDIESPPGRGTFVAATLPLAHASP